MHVRIFTSGFDIENTPEAVAGLFDRIDAETRERQVYFSHMVVNGEEVTDACREYLEERIDSVDTVEVVVLTPEQFLRRVMDVVEIFSEKALPAMQEVADEFYGKPDEQSWERFALVIQGVNELVELINALIADPLFANEIEEFARIGSRIGDELINLRDAAEREDMMLVGDIMHFELVPFVNSLHDAISALLERHAPAAC